MFSKYLTINTSLQSAVFVRPTIPGPYRNKMYNITNKTVKSEKRLR